MKKTFLFLAFALCATLVFAQSATPHHKALMVPSRAVPQERDCGSSLFTKDAALLRLVDFSTPNVGYSTGVVTSGPDAHGQNYDFAVWQRWPNLEDSTLVAASDTYPALTQDFGGPTRFATAMRNRLDTAMCSSNNGFMMIVPFEQQTPNSGNFNAYILFDSIDATGVRGLAVSFFQCFRGGHDHCYVGYSVDGGNVWTEAEVNIIQWWMSGYDRSVVCHFLLPSDTIGNLSVRIRYQSSDSSNPVYGYFWCIDDVSIKPIPLNRISTHPQEYVEGDYAMVPQGMTINPAWYSTILNTGLVGQTNVRTNLFHMDASDNAEVFASYDNGSLPVGSSMAVIADLNGWLFTDSLDYRGWYGYIDHTPHGQGSPLPTAELGDHYMFAQVVTDSISVNYDTMYYQVTAPNSNNEYRWAHDNGVLVYSPDNYYVFGYTNEDGNWYLSEYEEDVKFYMPGYSVTSRYTTDQVVPEDWVIHGMEIVASPVDGFHSTGAKISAVLTVDSYNGNLVDFRSVYTGANVKTVTDADVNDSTVIGRNSNGYLQQGEYNTVFIPFPEQPALTPNTSFRVGYALEDTAYFLPAQEAQGNYRLASPTREGYDTIIYFRNNSSTAKWAHYFATNQYEVFVKDPSFGGLGTGATFASWYRYDHPMIRLVVGPSRPITRQNVSVECENGTFGRVLFNGEEVCGTTITPAQGGSATVDMETGTGIAHVFVDSVDVQPWDENAGTGDRNYRLGYDPDSAVWTGRYTFENIQTDHSVKIVFAERLSVDPVAANVRLNLQPNPATDRVKLNIEGVEGNVSCKLIDMSGRVVYDRTFDAATAQSIDVSNLAKGAYFVRITNDKFSKVEKLIVR